ncbi:MAG TPA: helix-turn-helix domain-containing protein [Candidatus Xenobia bacterium]|jgi:excisionase family DNA binding protein
MPTMSSGGWQALLEAGRLVSAADVAEYIYGDGGKLSQARVYRMTRERLIPSVRIGRMVRYSPAAVQAWVDAGGTRL